MTPEQFVYWLQGYFELREGNSALTEGQTQIIKDHLQLVFKKETPDRNQTTQSNFPPRPWVRGAQYPNWLGSSWDTGWGRTIDEHSGADKVKSPLGDIPNWEGSC
jgi:hypothetical protein